MFATFASYPVLLSTADSQEKDKFVELQQHEENHLDSFEESSSTAAEREPRFIKYLCEWKCFVLIYIINVLFRNRHTMSSSSEEEGTEDGEGARYMLSYYFTFHLFEYNYYDSIILQKLQ